MSGNMGMTIVIIVIMVVAMYFLMIRPGRKQQQKQQEMMNSLSVGSRVMLGSGIYGTIRHMGEKQAIIEISPGVDLTILRAAIRSVVSPEDEEFEYADESGADSPDPDAPDQDAMAPFEADLASGPGIGDPDPSDKAITDSSDQPDPQNNPTDTPDESTDDNPPESDETKNDKK